MGELVHLTDSDLKDLTMNDVCVVWGGAKDVGRNESNMGMRALKQIISSLNYTNVIVINVPPRYDLAPNSCVNDEVQKFNRKLVKLEKAYLNLSIVTVDSNRDLFTRHGLHLNSQGKAHIANRLAKVINGLFTIRITAPIVFKWRGLGDAQHWVHDLEAQGQEDKVDKISMEIKKTQQEDKGGGKEEDRESENLSEGEQTMRTCEGVVAGEGSEKQQLSAVRCKKAVSIISNKCKLGNNIIDMTSKKKYNFYRNKKSLNLSAILQLIRSSSSTENVPTAQRNYLQ